MLECKTTIVAEDAAVDLVGEIDENSRDVFSHLHGTLAGSKRVTLDFEGVTLINSPGIRIWLNFLWGFQDGRELYFKNISFEIVHRLQVTKGLVGNGKILSFQIDFVCPACNADQLRSFEVTSGKDNILNEMANINCPKCNHLMNAQEDTETINLFFARALAS